jgi:hypothetical protein
MYSRLARAPSGRDVVDPHVTLSARWPGDVDDEGRPGWTRWAVRGGLALAVVMVLFFSAVALLFYADYSVAANGSPIPAERARWALDHERLS